MRSLWHNRAAVDKGVDVDDLRAEWTALCGRMGLADDDTLWDGIAQAYGEPQRHYHTLVHIAAVVRDGQRVHAQFDDADVALLALFFHDLIYDPARSDNEAQSAERMRALLADDVDAGRLSRAERHILATKSHARTGDADTHLVLDIDMAILGAAWTDYLAYAEGVAREYVPVYGLEAYAAGRANLFLTPTLARGPIFLTSAFAGCEGRAQQNLAEELKLWTSGVFAERLKDAL